MMNTLEQEGLAPALAAALANRQSFSLRQQIGLWSMLQQYLSMSSTEAFHEVYKTREVYENTVRYAGELLYFGDNPEALDRQRQELTERGLEHLLEVIEELRALSSEGYAVSTTISV